MVKANFMNGLAQPSCHAWCGGGARHIQQHPWLPLEMVSARQREDPALGEEPVLYAILCYNSEQTIDSWSKEHDAAVMARLEAVQEKLKRQGKLGPSLRLMPTSTAVTLRKDTQPYLVTDGPFAETKEAILGLYIIDCTGPDDALQIARELGEANPGGSYELRPVGYWQPGALA
jgi:hypothetical protein